jgi:hypothetical protein
MNFSRRHFLQTAAVGALAVASPSWVLLGQQPARDTPPSNSPVASVRYLGNQFLDNTVGVTGADGATSTVLPSGDALWVFGDTVEGPFKTIHGLDLAPLRSNTAALVPRQSVALGIKKFEFLATDNGQRPRQIVPFAPDEDPTVNRVWAMHGVWLGKHVYLYYHRITLLKGVDVFANFQLDGMGLARADAANLEFTRLTAPDGTREIWKGDEPSFGVFVDRDDDYIYLWGSLMTGMYLARVRPESIEDFSAYEYLVGAPTATNPIVSPRWSKKLEPTAALFDAVPNEMSAAFNRHLGKYVAIHSLHREHKIAMRTAPKITGPWSGPQVVYQPQRVGNADLIYAAKEHPELARDGGRVVYVTFVNSATYVPQMIEVTLR